MFNNLDDKIWVKADISKEYIFYNSIYINFKIGKT